MWHDVEAAGTRQTDLDSDRYDLTYAPGVLYQFVDRTTAP